MTTLLLVRHGESTANLQRRFAGNWDADLTPRGHAQAELTAKYITENYKVDAIYSSDLRRARETARHIADRQGLTLQLHKGLREISAGAWDGQPFEKIEADFPEDHRVWKNDIGNARCTNGEAVAEMADRVLAAVTEIALQNDGKTVVMVCHATPIRAMRCLWQGLAITDMQQVPWVTNASVTSGTFDNGIFTLQKIGADDHLASMITALPVDV